MKNVITLRFIKNFWHKYCQQPDRECIFPVPISCSLQKSILISSKLCASQGQCWLFPWRESMCSAFRTRPWMMIRWRHEYHWDAVNCLLLSIYSIVEIWVFLLNWLMLTHSMNIKPFHLSSVTDFQSTMSNHVPWLGLKRVEVPLETCVHHIYNVSLLFYFV